MDTATHVRVPQSWSPSLGWRPGRVYFLTILEPSRDDRTPALTARSASHMPPYGAQSPRSTCFPLMRLRGLFVQIGLVEDYQGGDVDDRVFGQAAGGRGHEDVAGHDCQSGVGSDDG